MPSRLPLGAPGIYRPAEPAQPTLAPARMDVCAFLGVAPRGPCREPRLPETWRFDRPTVGPAFEPRRRSVAVAVESFDEYRRLFGGFEGPGRLPYGVDTFFRQGGRRAFVVRIVHAYGDARDGEGVAEGPVDGAAPSAGTLRLRARTEGTWGNGLRVGLGFAVTALQADEASLAEFVLAQGERCVTGALLRIALAAGGWELRFAAMVRAQGEDDGAVRLRVTLDQALPSAADVAPGVGVVEGVLVADDGDGRRERHERLGLSREHPRWAATVLCHESELLWPDPGWAEGSLVPLDPERLPREPQLPPAGRFTGGEDRWAEITPEDFFDPGWVQGDPEPGDGVHALTHLLDLSSVIVPDLYCPEPLPPVGSALNEASLAGPEFAPCVDNPPVPHEQEDAAGQLEGLALDPRLPADLEAITVLQQRVVDLAERLRSFVVLLDVPPGLRHRQVLRWRSRFRSSYAAAYHPWLLASFPSDLRDALIRLNPSAAAAGILARQELRFGVPHGPANALADGAVDVEERVSPARHDELHPLGINVFLRERDGVRLTAARTLSRDPRWRQLSVRRLMLQLRRVLEQQTQWMVFEPNGPLLWADVRNLLRGYLGELHRMGAFRGATEDESFFVRCDGELNPRRVTDAGQLVAEVGVAPSEPLEFLVLQLTRTGEGTRAVEV